ncbi:MAG: YjjG family noncanonical pyrimidine nucleotidase [Spirochaetota bacterium]
MARYGLVFIDADETLFDFARGEEEALRATLAEAGIPFTLDVFDVYKAINARAWAEVEAGTLGREELKTRRFDELFAALRAGADPVKSGEYYLDVLSQQAWLIEGAVELCAALRSLATLVLLTNGITRVQRGRLGRSALHEAFDHVVISEEAGFAKPDPRVFELGAALAGIHDKNSMLMIGDSLASDIAGSINFGIDSCWYNPRRLAPGTIRPTYETGSLGEIAALMEPVRR